MGTEAKQVTLRVDPGVVRHFREGGAGWQTRIGAVLREHVASALREAEAKPAKRDGRA